MFEHSIRRCRPACSHSHVGGVLPAAAVHGDTIAFTWSAVIFGVGAVGWSSRPPAI
jgi:hypothetical protein